MEYRDHKHFVIVKLGLPEDFGRSIATGQKIKLFTVRTPDGKQTAEMTGTVTSYELQPFDQKRNKYYFRISGRIRQMRGRTKIALRPDERLNFCARYYPGKQAVNEVIITILGVKKRSSRPWNAADWWHDWHLFDD